MKTLMFTLFVLILLRIQAVVAADMPYQDPEFGCFTESQANQFISDFQVDVASFGGSELCDSNVDTKKLLNDINIVKNGLFTNDVKNNLIRGFVASNNYYNWMKSQTRGVQRGNDIPYATAYNSGGYFTMQDGWALLSTLGRVGTFVHEARHTQGFYHISCTQGPYQGSGVSGCDRDYNYGGSHAVEMEYYARVSVQGVNFHPVYKKMARLMAIARSNIFFNTTPLKTREGLLALSIDGQHAFLNDQSTWIEREIPSFVGSLKRTSFGAVLFNGLNALSIEMYQNSGKTDPVPDTYSYFKLLFENQKQLKDFEEFDLGIKRYAVKITKENKISSWDFPNGNWGGELALPIDVLRTSTALTSSKQSGYFIINSSGQVFAYQPESQKLVSQTEVWDSTNKQVVRFKNQNLILKNDGKIYVHGGQGLQLWPEANSIYSDLVAVPLYDAFEVVKQ